MGSKPKYSNLNLVPVKSEAHYKFKKGTTVQGLYRFGRGKNTRYYLVLQDGGIEGVSMELEIEGEEKS
jgi:hypothetical protein